MLLKHEIGVLIPIFIKNTNGQKIANYHPAMPDRVFYADFQPIKYNALYKPYGITDTTSNLLLCEDFNLTVDMHLLINESQYKIDSILAYKKHVEVYLSKVV